MYMFKKFCRSFFPKVSVLILLICLISLQIVPFAGAVNYTGEGTATFEVVYSPTGSMDDEDRTIVSTYDFVGSLPYTNYSVLCTPSSWSGINGWSIIRLVDTGTGETVFTSPTSVYFSFFPYDSEENTLSYGSSSGDFRSFAVDVNTDNRVDYGSILATRFDVVGYPGTRYGFLFNYTFDASDSQPLRNLSFYQDDSYVTYQRFYSGSQLPYVQVVSYRIVTTETTAEMEGLENIADSITAQSEILSAFYGDIVAVCNEIYSRLGDMQATAELANVYFSQMVQLLQHIDTTTTNIYNLLPGQFALLESAINTATDNITEAIQGQTNALIAYFDSVFSGAVGDLPQKSDDLDTNIGSLDQSESEYKSDASARFESLSTQFTGFTGGTLSGIALASNLFTQVWNALGEYSIVYSFPLLFGLCLLLIGRLSKHSGGQSSTDKERGDSDA